MLPSKNKVNAYSTVTSLTSITNSPRYRRLQVEKQLLGHYIPPGPWDADCDKWPEQTYIWDLGGGFKGTIMRSTTHWTWCGYITLPAWYPYRNKPYRFWNGEDGSSYGRFPKLPVRELTYGGNNGPFGMDTPGKYGFDHAWGSDLMPLPRLPPGQTTGPGCHPGCYYTTAEKAMEEVDNLGNWFATLALTRGVPVSADILAANRAGLLAVQQRVEARLEKRRLEKAAAEAVVKAEAERKAAEEAERQRLWDIEHSEEAAIRDASARSIAASKTATTAHAVALAAVRDATDAAAKLEAKKARVPRLQELLAEIERLEEYDEDSLSAADRRQIKRKDQIERELANLTSSNNWRMKELEADVVKKQELAAAAETKAKVAMADADAAEKEATALKEAFTSAKAKKEADAKAAAEKKEADAKAAEVREFKQRRLHHVISLLADIEVLRTRRAAGEILDPLQGKKMGRRQALEKERTELKAAIAQ